ncbi:DUF2339 domain-containing protein [Marivita sp. S2033]|uniref:DUF2339 domain-containing protein n=1 Tax=Marivita sp. S2033 TaxID=3373187 RepID=UPI00398212BE
MDYDLLFLIFGLLGLFYMVGMPILVIVLYARIKDLQKRLDALDFGSDAVIPTRALVAKAPSDPTAALSAETSTETGPWASSGKNPADAMPPDALMIRSGYPVAVARFGRWITSNWVYVVSAVSLALAGVFLVQYGVENGLLPPAARVMAALLFGVVLIGGGEWVRRRAGDTEETPSAYLPSVFSGAGIVSLFGGILAARVLYDLIAPGTAFGGFFLVTLVALVLGWFYGPLLAAVGLVGGFSAPFILGGASDTPELLLLYFGLLAVLGLGIDTVRRWGWVSILAVTLALIAASLLWLSKTSIAPWTSVYAAVIAMCAVIIPARSLSPDQGGRTILYSTLGRRKAGQPVFAVWLSGGTLLAAVGLIVAVTPFVDGQFWLSYLILSALAVVFAVWSKTATGLQDQTLVPTLGALSLLAWPDAHGPVLRTFQGERLPEIGMAFDTVWVLGIAVLVTLVFAWRSGQGRMFTALWAAAAAVYLPTVGLLLEYRWAPSDVIGPFPWALQALAVAALMVLLAERFARRDGAERTRASLATMSALATVAFALSILFTSAALTIALSAVIVSAAALDRRFALPLMEWFILAGVAALSYRLVVDPGLAWAVGAPVIEAFFAQGAAVAACLGGLWCLKPLVRTRAQAALDSGAWAFGGILVSTMTYHAITALAPNTAIVTHWSAGLYATIWLGLAIAQLQRMASFPQLRIGLASLFGLLGALWLGTALTVVNPVFGMQVVVGPPVLNTLIPAYLMPSLVLLGGAWRLTNLSARIRVMLVSTAALCSVVWVALVIRDFWHPAGDLDLRHGFTQPELYSYTVALLIAGGLLFYQSLARNSDLLRRAGLAVIAVAIAKVFLIDISGLTGLTRVFSLLALGLMLAGMAWVDRWARSRRVT